MYGNFHHKKTFPLHTTGVQVSNPIIKEKKGNNTLEGYNAF